VSRQCSLLGLSRSSLYYRAGREEGYNERLMRLLDGQYTRVPFYGVARMTAWLRREGHAVNPKRVRRLMRTMGLEAIYPKRRLSAPGKENRIYPYLLSGVSITHADQVWGADITYVRMRRGFVYLVAILDWHSRFVVAWGLSLTLETGFCVETLERALRGSQPGVFNTDQGSQFTSAAFTKRLEAAGIRISMDGRRRMYDNIFVERLWRTVKYEEVYLKDYEDMEHARENLERYFVFYNEERLHQSLGYATPASVYLNHPPRKD
jgi:putative transposase